MDDGCSKTPNSEDDKWSAVMADLNRDLASEGWNIDSLKRKWEAWPGSRAATDRPRAFQAWAMKWTEHRQPGDETTGTDSPKPTKIRIGTNDPRWQACLAAVEPLITRAEDRRANRARGYIDASPQWLATILNQAV